MTTPTRRSCSKLRDPSSRCCHERTRNRRSRGTRVCRARGSTAPPASGARLLPPHGRRLRSHGALDGGIGIDSALLRGNAQQIRALLRRSMYEDPKDVLGSVAGYLVNTGSKLVLIDAGAGGHWGGPTLGRLVANLRASGYSPDQVDVVLITHLHADHVGGIYGADGSRVFPNAEIRMAKADSDFWLSTDVAAKAPPEAQVFFQVARMRPHHTSPPASGGHSKVQTIVPGVRPYPIIGHTPGHMGYEVTSQGQSLLVWGDVVHVMAVQMARPGVGIEFDIDGPTAIKARGELFAKLSASKTLVAGAICLSRRWVSAARRPRLCVGSGGV